MQTLHRGPSVSFALCVARTTVSNMRRHFVHPCNGAPFITGRYCWIAYWASSNTAPERADDTLAIAVHAGWPWSTASVMTSKTVILMKVFPLPDPDIVPDNCPLISLLTCHMDPYVCKSMRALVAAGRWVKMCGWGAGLTPGPERDDTSSNDNGWEAGRSYRGGFHKSHC